MPLPIIRIFEQDPDDLRTIADNYAELLRFCEGDRDMHPEVAVMQRFLGQLYERAAPMAAQMQALKARGEGKTATARKLSAKARRLLERIDGGEKP